uniref:Uncharacterized protein n=1 Tax=Utricularia reniformis TaxID=192314 RepID=A0A1Y0B2A3_9LAMI|nr:hypothetical protein AEK19_MT1326 [Utricularia reniformis]ART31524.1 hypothetical protein AEK19_MT1326 [Utricularia reniformis]
MFQKAYESIETLLVKWFVFFFCPSSSFHSGISLWTSCNMLWLNSIHLNREVVGLNPPPGPSENLWIVASSSADGRG